MDRCDPDKTSTTIDFPHYIMYAIPREAQAKNGRLYSWKTCTSLQKIAKAENRFVSNVAERKIILGLRAGPDRTGSDLTEEAPLRHDWAGPNPEELKTSVLNVLDNLPAKVLHTSQRS